MMWRMLRTLRMLSSLCDPKKFNGHNHVADVADSFQGTPLAPRSCAQCNADEDGKLQFYSHAPNAPLGVWLHKECKPFYFGER